MAEIKGFLKYKRQEVGHKPVEERIRNFDEFDIALTPDQIYAQAARCMDCGVPFCHGWGCPLHNCIPDINNLVYKGRWREACELLHSANNFPEITGRVCPALCEPACCLAINDDPVLIKHIELQIVERGFEQGWIRPIPPAKKTGKKVAIVGSGPAGLAAAQQMARAGHTVVVFEKSEKAGGLLRYGIPDFKLPKNVIDRRLSQLVAEGVEFRQGVKVGEDISARYIKKMFDCICLTMGAGQPRDLNIPGRGYENVVLAVDYLTAQNKLNSGEPLDDPRVMTAKDKTVVVIGGGDTGSDCVGTARRQGAKEIYQFEILPKPPETRPDDTPWPFWPRIMRTSSSQEEGCTRRWAVKTKQLSGSGTYAQELRGCEVEWIKKDNRWEIKEIEGSDFVIKTDLVIVATGFSHVVHEGLIKELGLKLDNAGNIYTENCQTSEPNVFAAGDAITGASLVAHAINSGRTAAEAMNNWLSKSAI